MKQFWKPRHSITLSLVITYLSAAALLASMFFAQRLIELLLGLPPSYARGYALVFYFCCPAGWAALGSLLKILHNLRAGRVFVQQNVKLLRLLSWCFVFVALVSFASIYWLPSLLIVGIAAAFLGLILRVVKNVIAQAMQLREENDLTI